MSALRLLENSFSPGRKKSRELLDGMQVAVRLPFADLFPELVGQHPKSFRDGIDPVQRNKKISMADILPLGITCQYFNPHDTIGQRRVAHTFY